MLCWNVALSNNGRSFACATYFSDFIGDTAGLVLVYDYDASSERCLLKGSRVDGKATYNCFAEHFTYGKSFCCICL